VTIFLRKNMRNKGMHRFLEGLTIDSRYKIVFVGDIRETQKYELEFAIFAGFLPEEVVANYSVKNKYYVFCSPLGQADLSSGESQATMVSSEIAILYNLNYFIGKGEIKNCICSSEYLAEKYGFIYLPPVKLGNEAYVSFNKDRSKYGFLGNNLRKHRNIANQLCAISMITPKEDIVVSHVKPYDLYSELFDFTFEVKSNLSNEDYYKEIGSHKLGFVCSFSESFSYQALEYAFMGVPCIVGANVSWYPIGQLIVPNVDSFIDIKDTAETCLRPELYWNYSEELYTWAGKFNENQKEKLLKVIEDKLEK